ncbi:MAG TPA: single-stranded DNA-binding protein, partial [Gemmataceae bacterium]|nr:single-stranded DNA-binding protein [Gemmataceae bacterium]
RGDYGKLADVVEQYLRKGRQIFIEGHLKLDQWTSQDGQKRSKLTVIADNVQFLEPRAEGGMGGAGGGTSSMPRRPAAAAPAAGGYDDHAPEPERVETADAAPEAEIPF